MMPPRLVFALTITLFGAAPTAQTPPASIYPGGCEVPASQRTSDAGCYLNAVVPMEEISEPVFWHLYTYPTIAAAEAARAKNGTAVQSLGKFWVFTLAGQAWRPETGERVSVIGPLPIKSGVRYTARYMESTLPPGATSVVHTHSGPEAFYTVSGAQCLETPDGVIMSRAGESAIIQAGPPMLLSGVGTENRRAVLVVLHDSRAAWMKRESSWVPARRCPR